MSGKPLSRHAHQVRIFYSAAARFRANSRFCSHAVRLICCSYVLHFTPFWPRIMETLKYIFYHIAEALLIGVVAVLFIFFAWGVLWVENMCPAVDREKCLQAGIIVAMCYSFSTLYRKEK